jgi:predicted DNA-binding transcriptional regulator YafY
MELEEAVSLWIARRLAGVVGGVPLVPAGAEPEKALAALGAEDRAEVGRIVKRIVVGGDAEPEVRAVAGPVEPAVFDTCIRAFVRCRPVALLYRDSEGRVTERRVEPHGLMVRAPLWYLLGFDLRKELPRHFRLDRVQAAHTMVGPRFQPRDPRELFEDLEGLVFDVT